MIPNSPCSVHLVVLVYQAVPHSPTSTSPTIELELPIDLLLAPHTLYTIEIYNEIHERTNQHVSRPQRRRIDLLRALLSNLPGTPNHQPNSQTPRKKTNRQIFYLTHRTFALVNLKPILPGHVLVCPRRVVPRVTDLTPPEASDLFLTVQRVGQMIERVYGASSLNIAIQDGTEAGQSVAHVHTHVIPRKKRDLDHRGGTDAIYEMLDGEEGNVGKVQEELKRQKEQEQGHEQVTERKSSFPAVDDEARRPRTMEEMEVEAQVLAKEMEKEPVD